MKKGFTLIELLTVIAVLAIILLIAVPNVISVINDVKLNAYTKDEDLMIKATTNYLAANPTLFPNNIGEVTKVNLSTLTSGNYISEIKDIKNSGSNCSGYILVKKENISKITYTPVLTCNNNFISDNYLIDGLLIQYDGYDAPQNITGNYYWMDRSTNANNGRLYNMALTSTSGYNSTTKSYVFDGSDDYISSISSLSSMSNYTVELIFRAYDYRYTEIATGSADFKWRQLGENPWWNFWDTLNAVQIVGYATIPALSTTNSYVYTFNGTNLMSYYNNTLDKNVSVAGRSTRNPSALVMGTGSEKVYGEVYAMRVYNRVLNAVERTHHYDTDKLRFNF